MWTALTIAGVLAAACALYGALAVAAHAAGTPAWLLVAAAPLLYLAVVALFVASYFVLAWIFRARRPPEAHIGVGATVRLVWLEYWTLAGAALRMLFYRALVPTPPAAPAALPVVLVHGVLCNAGVWARVVRFLRAQGVGPLYGLSYGPPLASIERFAEQLDALIRRVRERTGAADVMLVTHSMGGLGTLAYLRRYGASSVRRWVAIGAPFAGSVHARGFVGVSLAQLRPGNAWLRALDPRAPAGGPPVVSIWSWHDSMVTPQTSSRLPGAIDVPLAGVGHNALLREPAVLERVLREYRVAERTGPALTRPSGDAAAVASPVS
jgi:pimeloyl-ACP methyl ester carboxylesterase